VSHRKAWTASFILHAIAGLALVTFMSLRPLPPTPLEFTLDSIRFAKGKSAPLRDPKESGAIHALPSRSELRDARTKLAPPLRPAITRANALPNRPPQTLQGIIDAKPAIHNGVFGSPLQSYILRVRDQVEAQLEKGSHPETGQVQVRLTISATGSLISARIVQTSGSSTLEQTVLNSVHAAAPFPPFEGAKPTKPLRLLIPIEVRDE
jgi:TonB family protein